MLSSRTPSRRRRSHSIAELSSSPSPIAKRISNDASRSSTKRNHPFSPGLHHDSSPYKWDVDMWRRGKRARMNPSTPGQDSNRLSTSETSSLSDEQSPPPTVGPPSLPTFASTSAAFHLFPPRHGNTASSHSATNQLRANSMSPPQNPPKRSRSHAFDELQRSIAENGELLVGRMRDLEELGYRGPSTGPQIDFPGRGRSASTHFDNAWESDDPFTIQDDDVHIIAATQNASSDSWSPRKKRAVSLGGAAHFASEFTFHCQDDVRRGRQDSSPVATRASSPSLNSWVDVGVEEEEEDLEDDMVQELPFSRAALPSPPIRPYNPLDRMDFTPELSHTLTNSTNSSLISLPLASSGVSSSSPIYPRSRQNSRAPIQHCGGAVLPLALQASREEKAIAALTLAMANGAGGVNDYYDGAVNTAPSANADDDYAGDLWH